uniref:Uncharacterized protein n=1 Tax=viral metagenome TaxID=1070528 RepID=A0A6C0HSK0_9ZZZZ
MDYSKKDDRFLPIPENEENEEENIVKNLNPRKHVLKRIIDRQKTFITVFETNFSNTYAMNAVTNRPYKIKFGSKGEDSLFSVIIATGETGQTPLILFYDSPEQYERHFFVRLSPKTKQLWHKKTTKHRIQTLP